MMHFGLLSACLAAALLVACGGEDPGGGTQAPGTVLVDGRTANDHGSVSLEPGQEIEVAAGDFFFAPTVLIGPPGGPEDVAAPSGTQVAVVVTSTGTAEHNVSIPEQDLDVDVAPGATIELVVTFPDRGTLVFACKYHEDRGMAGALVAA